MDSPHVHIILNGEGLPPALVGALDRASAAVTVDRVEGARQPEACPQADAVVVVAPRDQRAAKPWIERVFASLADRPCGTLVLTKDPLNGLALAARPDGVPISFAVDPPVDELTARLATVCEYGDPLRHITERAEHMMQRGRKMLDEANHLDEQLRLAAQVQRDFLPNALPQCEGVRFVTLFKPVDYVSGDIYDIARLDETHIGISLADVTGHGVPAALLTLFVKGAWRPKEIDGNSYRIVPPDELLGCLNRDVLEADLQQCQFVTACCAVYDNDRRILTWARGGLPYPILIRPGTPARQIRTDGELIGAFDQARFELRHEQLQTGDTVIFFSDGLEALLLGGSANQCDLLEQTEWFKGLHEGTIEDHFTDIERRLDRVPDHRWPRDDVTMVAICVDH